MTFDDVLWRIRDLKESDYEIEDLYDYIRETFDGYEENEKDDVIINNENHLEYNTVVHIDCDNPKKIYLNIVKLEDEKTAYIKAYTGELKN